MEKTDNLKVGEIVQLDASTKMFAYSMMVVTELKAFGAQGYVQALGENGEPGGQAYFRARWDQMERTGGMAVWVPALTMHE